MSYSGSSWDDDLTTRLVMIVLGHPNAGKTTLATTLSKFYPKDGLPTIKHKGPAKYTLKDLYWGCYDKGALLSFKERGIAVPRFDIRAYMAEKKASIVGATEAFLMEAEKAVRSGAQWVIVDTLSKYDEAIDTYCLRTLLGDKALRSENVEKSVAQLTEQVQIKKYGLLYGFHKLLHDELTKLGAGICYLTHAKAQNDVSVGVDAEAKEKLKKVRATTSVAGQTGVLKPAVTGQGLGVYVRDARLQLALRVTKGASGLVRQLYAEPIDGFETKNAWELSIKGPQEPHLGKLLAKVNS